MRYQTITFNIAYPDHMPNFFTAEWIKFLEENKESFFNKMYPGYQLASLVVSSPGEETKYVVNDVNDINLER